MALALSGAAMALVAQSSRLPMMPMRLDDVLLPGETSRLLLKEPAHLALLNAVQDKHDFLMVDFHPRDPSMQFRRGYNEIIIPT